MDQEKRKTEEDSGRTKGRDIRIRNDWRPGDLGEIVRLHGILYHREQGFDTTFEPYVAEPLARAVLHPSERQRFWIVEENGTMRGCIAVVEESAERAALRWFLLHPEVRGLGLGRRLLAEAVAFCRASGYREVFLWTVDDLSLARKLYREQGFELEEEHRHPIWGKRLNEQKYRLLLERPEA
jgi:N-acetylglutamate synthase-like GNAT family acetyltransferase